MNGEGVHLGIILSGCGGFLSIRYRLKKNQNIEVVYSVKDYFSFHFTISNSQFLKMKYYFIIIIYDILFIPVFTNYLEHV